MGQVLCQTVDRGHSTNIGISLAGHRDRNKMACFVAGINPKGIASAGGLEIGDEILEVSTNGEDEITENYETFSSSSYFVLG